jgi:hypothetical protein
MGGDHTIFSSDPLVSSYATGSEYLKHYGPLVETSKFNYRCCIEIYNLIHAWRTTSSDLI